MTIINKVINADISKGNQDINQGDCVSIINYKDIFQVIGIDLNHDKCWVRKWPLQQNGSPVFEISTNDIEYKSN